MITSNIIGGLGNQMFQYACGLALSTLTDQQHRITTDQFDQYNRHNGYELQSVFNLRVHQVTAAELKCLLSWQSKPALRRLFVKPAMQWATNRNWCIEPHFEYWPGIKNIRGSKYLHGYWQSERYFIDVSDQIREVFQFKKPWNESDLSVYERMRAQPSVSIHVRRGDYTLTKNHGIYAHCGIDYYTKAIHLLKQHIPEVRLFVFSDDPEWVIAQFGLEFGPFETIRHNSGTNSANDMRLMSLADHNIIANSSFSWWGAWLNSSPNKIVISPRSWFNNSTNDIDLIPDSWIRL